MITFISKSASKDIFQIALKLLEFLTEIQQKHPNIPKMENLKWIEPKLKLTSLGQ